MTVPAHSWDGFAPCRGCMTYNHGRYRLVATFTPEPRGPSMTFETTYPARDGYHAKKVSIHPASGGLMVEDLCCADIAIVNPADLPDLAARLAKHVGKQEGKA